jgi:hemolysin D
MLSSQPLHSDVDQPGFAKIRILLVDDQRTVRYIWQSYLVDQPDLEVIGHAADGEGTLVQVASLHPDIILLDIEMPGMDGLTTTRLICDRHAQTKVIVLSSHDHEEYIRKALQAGAKGYLLKNTPAPELIHAIRFVQKGYLQMGPGLFEKLAGDSGELVSGVHTPSLSHASPSTSSIVSYSK